CERSKAILSVAGDCFVANAPRNDSPSLNLMRLNYRGDHRSSHKTFGTHSAPYTALFSIYPFPLFTQETAGKEGLHQSDFWNRNFLRPILQRDLAWHTELPLVWWTADNVGHHLWALNKDN